jgi:hypothetical protein
MEKVVEQHDDGLRDQQVPASASPRYVVLLFHVQRYQEAQRGSRLGALQPCHCNSSVSMSLISCRAIAPTGSRGYREPPYSNVHSQKRGKNLPLCIIIIAMVLENYQESRTILYVAKYEHLSQFVIPNWGTQSAFSLPPSPRSPGPPGPPGPRPPSFLFLPVRMMITGFFS